MFSAINQDNDTDSVKTSVGRIQGHLMNAPGSEHQVWEYMGIPFVKPPVGVLRFSDPEPLDKLPQGWQVYAISLPTDSSFEHSTV